MCSPTATGLAAVHEHISMPLDENTQRYHKYAGVSVPSLFQRNQSNAIPFDQSTIQLNHGIIQCDIRMPVHFIYNLEPIKNANQWQALGNIGRSFVSDTFHLRHLRDLEA